MDIDVIVAGHLCLDLIPDMLHLGFQDLAKPGKLYEIGPIGIATGGAVSNTGLALNRLGVNVRLVSVVGDDLIGQIILNHLASHDAHLTDGIIIKPGAVSSSTLVLSPRDMDRSFMHCAGTNIAFSAADIDFALVEQARIFHLGYPPLLPKLIANEGEELSLVFRRAKAAGVITSMDMVVPDPNAHSGRVDWRSILRKTLPYVDIFLPSIEELLFMLRRSAYDEWHPNIFSHLNRVYLYDLAEELLSMGSSIVGFKLGELGIYLRTGKTLDAFSRLPIDVKTWTSVEYCHPAFQVNVVGATGAGDAAYAGLLASLLRGFAPVEALRWACAAGACACEAMDSTSGIRTWVETGARLNTGWSYRPERLPGF